MFKTTLLLCLLAPLLASCAATGPKTDTTVEPEVVTKTRVVDTACDWTEPIFVSKADVLSDATAKAILAYDKTGAAKCGWKAAK